MIVRVSFLIAFASTALFNESVSAQVVQLPVVGVTSVATTVSVPDRGGMTLGRIHRSRNGSIERGIGPGPLLSSRGIGAETSTAEIGISATIIDHDELDRMVLAEGRRRRLASGEELKLVGKAAYLSRHVARNPRIENIRSSRNRRSSEAALVLKGSRTPSVAELRRKNALARQQRAAEATEYFEQGKAAEAKGKKSVAKIYYQMAHLRATGDLKVQIAARLKVVSTPKKTQKTPAKNVSAKVASR